MSPAYVLSFDVEEHHRIEAAYGLTVPEPAKAVYADRMERTTRLLLDRLAAAGVRATFFVVGEIALTHRKMVRDIAAGGHEVGSHSHDHRRVHRFDADSFRDDLMRSKEALEDATSRPVFGFRAPTFSLMKATAWAIDVLVGCGFRYDSSVFPVRHDRYGVPDAPRSPFVVQGASAELLELPPATWRVLGQNLPVAGGGYFRLFPQSVLHRGLRMLPTQIDPSVGMLYFHPWEFDPDQPRLPLKGLSRWRTYVGTGKTLGRLDRLLQRFPFRRAIDVVAELEPRQAELPRFRLAG